MKSCEILLKPPDIIHSQYKLLDGLESAQHDMELHCKYTVFVAFDLLAPSSVSHICQDKILYAAWWTSCRFFPPTYT